MNHRKYFILRKLFSSRIYCLNGRSTTVLAPLLLQNKGRKTSGFLFVNVKINNNFSQLFNVSTFPLQLASRIRTNRQNPTNCRLFCDSNAKNGSKQFKLNKKRKRADILGWTVHSNAQMSYPVSTHQNWFWAWKRLN